MNMSTEESIIKNLVLPPLTPYSIGFIFPARAPSNTTLADQLDVDPGDDRTASSQALHQFYALLVTLGISIVSGLLTGAFIRVVPFGRKPKKPFSDDEFWETPDDFDRYGPEAIGPDGKLARMSTYNGTSTISLPVQGDIVPESSDGSSHRSDSPSSSSDSPVGKPDSSSSSESESQSNSATMSL